MCNLGLLKKKIYPIAGITSILIGCLCSSKIYSQPTKPLFFPKIYKESLISTNLCIYKPTSLKFIQESLKLITDASKSDQTSVNSQTIFPLDSISFIKINNHIDLDIHYSIDQSHDGCVSPPVSLTFASGSNTGYTLRVSSPDEDYPKGSSWNLQSQELADKKLAFILLANKDENSSSTPITDQGFCHEVNSGTKIYNAQAIFSQNIASSEVNEYLIALYILNNQFYENPSGMYTASLIFKIEAN